MFETKKEFKETVIQQADPLKLDISDGALVKVIDKRIEDSKTWYKNNRNLYERQNNNEKYYLGKQINESNLKDYNCRYSDNLIYSGMATIKPIALSRLPDLIVSPGNNTDESKEQSKRLTTILNSDIKRRQMRKALAMAFKHLPIYFIGVIKYFWNPELGKDGDYEFRVIHPKNILIDHTCTSNDANDADFIAETIPTTIKEMIMRFPDKEEEILYEAGVTGGDPKKEEKMATKVDMVEVWFTWYQDEGNGKYSRIEGVAWKFKKLLLKSMKNPNWDWEGNKRIFKYDTATKKKEQPTFDELKMFAEGNMELQTEEIFYNYFENPEKPYILLGYDQLGMMPYDETSIIEQAIPNQDNHNKRGKQISEMIDRARGKNVFSEDSGLKKEDIEELDMNDPDTDLLVKGKLTESYMHIPGESANAAMFEDLSNSTTSIFSIMGTHSTTRGQKETNVATTSQILREADYGRIDDLTEETINYACERIAKAAMQMIRLRYTKDHMRRILGKDGDTAFEKVNRDIIEDGQEVSVYASGVDKLMRKREAYELAKMKMIDPITFFEDTDRSNPKERTEKLMIFLQSPDTYMSKYVMGLETTKQQAGALNKQPASTEQPTSTPEAPATDNTQLAVSDIQLLIQGQPVTPPANLDSTYLEAFNQFLQSSDFASLDPQVQTVIAQYAQQLSSQAQTVIS